MSQNGKLASSLVVGVVASLLVITLLISSVIASSLAGWLWIVILAVSAGLFGGSHSLNHQSWSALGAYTAGAGAVFVFLVDKVNLSGVIPPALVLLGVAVPFFVTWRADHRQLLSLTVAYILVAAIPIVLIEAATDYEEVLITFYVLLAIGAGLVGGYQMNRSRAQR